MRRTVFICIVVLFSTIISANPLNETVQRVVDFEGFWGAILVARGEVILHAAGYGMADVERDIPNTPEKKFRIASITKQITAAAILQLAERGELTLDDPLSMYLEGFPNGEKILLKYMLNHSSGIPTMINTGELLDKISVYKDGKSLQRAEIEYISTLPLRFEPGTSFLYSNSAYFLLGVVIEKVSGMPYDEYLRKNIFEPLGMNNTGYDFNVYDSGWALPYHCQSYVIDDECIREADWVDRRLPGGAGGLYSTVYDLYLWDRALYGADILSRESVKIMETPSSQLYEAGLGVFVGTEFIAGQYRRLVYHDGDTKGTSTRINRYVEDDIFIVVLSNIEGKDFTSLAHELARAVIMNDMGR
jgi:CubicO group peptidase (beta-lactamase class C family)